MRIRQLNSAEVMAAQNLPWLAVAEPHLWADRALAAEIDGEIVGIASFTEARLHRTRLWMQIDVAFEHRREGIGTALAKALADTRTDARPFAVKAEEGSAELAFVRSLGATDYQLCPPSVIDPRNPAVQSWALENATVPVVQPADVLTEDAIEAFIDLYEWTHEEWSPIASREIAREAFGPEIESSLHDRASAFALGEGRIRAAAFAYAPIDDVIDVVAETREREWVADRDEADAERAIRSCLASSILAAAGDGVRAIAVDHHASDPHTAPAVASIPAVTGTPLHLTEWRP